MKRLLLNCDQVFDVLTRGPFPSGEPTDDAVEHHLRACHDCRQLAEALRPTVAMLHEAVSAEQAIDLPEYQGSLPFRRPVLRKLSMVRLAGTPRGEFVERLSFGERLPSSARPRHQNGGGNSVRLISAMLLSIGLAVWLWGLATDSRTGHSMRAGRAAAPAWPAAREGVPGAGELMTLANLRLPSDCLPLTHRPLSRGQAAEMALALFDGSLASLQCCTECHHARRPAAGTSGAAAVARTTRQHCQACHRG